MNPRFKNLELFVADMNIINRLFGSDYEITFPLTAHDKHLIREHLEAELSPENLTCDGELSPTEVTKKRNHLNAIKQQLEAV